MTQWHSATAFALNNVTVAPGLCRSLVDPAITGPNQAPGL